MNKPERVILESWDWSDWAWTYVSTAYMPWTTNGYDETYYPPIEEGLIVGTMQVGTNYGSAGNPIWTRATRTLDMSVSRLTIWIGCSGSTQLAQGGVRIYVNGNILWSRTENQFAQTGQVGWILADISFTRVSNPIIIIERYHNAASHGNFSIWMTGLTTYP